MRLKTKVWTKTTRTTRKHRKTTSRSNKWAIIWKTPSPSCWRIGQRTPFSFWLIILEICIPVPTPIRFLSKLTVLLQAVTTLWKLTDCWFWISRVFFIMIRSLFLIMSFRLISCLRKSMEVVASKALTYRRSLACFASSTRLKWLKVFCKFWISGKMRTAILKSFCQRWEQSFCTIVSLKKCLVFSTILTIPRVARWRSVIWLRGLTSWDLVRLCPCMSCECLRVRTLKLFTRSLITRELLKLTECWANLSSWWQCLRQRPKVKNEADIICVTLNY